jgi:hypothetical protein
MNYLVEKYQNNNSKVYWVNFVVQPPKSLTTEII